VFKETGTIWENHAPQHGIDPAAVSHVIATHLHTDHYDCFDAFPNAKFIVNRREYEETSRGASTTR